MQPKNEQASQLKAYYYLLAGIVLGLIPVVWGTISILSQKNASFSWNAIWAAHTSDPLLPILDLLPILLGLVLWLIGRRAEKTAALLSSLQEEVKDSTQALMIANEKLIVMLDEKTQTDLAIERAKRAWEATVDAVRDYIILIDVDGSIVRCNRATSIACNTNFQELIGKNISTTVLTEAYPNGKALPEGQREVQFAGLEGEYLVNYYPLKLENGRDGVVINIHKSYPNPQDEAGYEGKKNTSP